MKNLMRKPAVKSNKKPASNGNYPAKGSKSVYLFKRILITNFFTLLILAFTYLWIVYLLSNASSFWDIFRGKQASYSDKDTVAPITPYLNPISEATKDDQINITGQSETGVKITLYVNGAKSQETVADGEGQFSFANIPVTEVDQDFYVIAIDEAGNQSKPSAPYKTRKDITPPEFSVNTPEKDGTTFKSTGRTYQVAGTTEPGTSITINEQFALVLQTGEFTANVRLEEGNNKLVFKALDKAGNETVKEYNVKYEKVE